jgi:Mitochondrial carrier protein
MSAKKKSSHFSSGFASGIFGSFLTQPFEVIKTTIIVNPMKTIEYDRLNSLKSMISASKEVYAHEGLGLRNFFRGAISASLKQAFGFGTYVFLLDKMNKFINTEEKMWKYISYMFTSGVSKGSAIFLTAPFLLLKTRMELIDHSHTSYLSILKDVIHKHGVKGLFQGFNSILGRDLSYTIFHYGMYQYLRDEVFTSSKSNAFISGVPAFIAGVIANLVSQPFEVVRNLVQADRQMVDAGVVSNLARIYKKEGVRGFFKGALPRLIRKPVNSGITWMVYEVLVFQESIN